MHHLINVFSVASQNTVRGRNRQKSLMVPATKYWWSVTASKQVLHSSEDKYNCKRNNNVLKVS